MMQTEHRDAGSLERAVGRVLRVGISTTTICLTVALALTLTGAGGRFAAPLLTIGLVILLATPVARVAV